MYMIMYKVDSKNENSIIKRIFNIVFVIMTLILLQIGCKAKHIKEWTYENNNWHYYDSDGKIVKSKWEYENGNWYYLNQDGNMSVSSWIGNYYVDDKGIMVSGGWVDVDGKKYFFENDGQVNLSRDYDAEQKLLRELSEKQKQQNNIKTIKYTDAFGEHSIDFIFPTLPLKNSSGITINKIDMYYSQGDMISGIKVRFVCYGNKSQYEYPSIWIYAGNGIFPLTIDSSNNNSYIASSDFRPITEFDKKAKYDINVNF